jgi:methyltransferase (TIGR00027 family)
VKLRLKRPAASLIHGGAETLEHGQASGAAQRYSAAVSPSHEVDDGGGKCLSEVRLGPRPVPWSSSSCAFVGYQTMKPISNTAFYCCGIRMRDAESRRPVCGDQFAKLFMNGRGMEIFSRFAGERGPNMSNVARARYIDDLLRARLALNSHLQVVLIGCGFDSRPFRLRGGSWFELDEPAIIRYKDERLPAAEAPNVLQRIPIDFETESLREKLRPLVSSVPTVFVIEGVTMYISGESLRSTLGVFQSLFPHHQVIVDLMTRRFIETYGKNVKRIIAQLGAQMIPGDQPALPFEACGYRQVSSDEIARLAFAYQSLGWLAPILRLLFPGLFTGYTVRVFEPGLAAPPA